ncbi:MAG TPA: acetyl-coenzyme A synthetase N-terminal domain-containing protein [Gammaproteobacteria bacterium]|nr:acetyl-coenzyme A synthetase N-terminal domain-containing protein [Gammaproteobacteria bacterium]
MEKLKLALSQTGLSSHESEKIAIKVKSLLQTLSPENCWQKISQDLLPKLPFASHLVLYKTVYPDWEKIPAPAWQPEEAFIQSTNLAKLMAEKGFKNAALDYQAFHRWSVDHYPQFWSKMLSLLNLVLDLPYTNLVDLSEGLETPRWLPGAKLNIANSCFQAKKNALAIVSQTEQGKIQKITYG